MNPIFQPLPSFFFKEKREVYFQENIYLKRTAFKVELRLSYGRKFNNMATNSTLSKTNSTNSTLSKTNSTNSTLSKTNYVLYTYTEPILFYSPCKTVEVSEASLEYRTKIIHMIS